jgi:hypothetical protein
MATPHGLGLALCYKKNAEYLLSQTELHHCLYYYGGIVPSNKEILQILEISSTGAVLTWLCGVLATLNSWSKDCVAFPDEELFPKVMDLLHGRSPFPYMHRITPLSTLAPEYLLKLYNQVPGLAWTWHWDNIDAMPTPDQILSERFASLDCDPELAWCLYHNIMPAAYGANSPTISLDEFCSTLSALSRALCVANT